jgi:hypothetical protein
MAQTNVTMTQLRAITSATPGQTFNVTDAGKQGLYRYDNTDNITPGNTGTVVLANQGVANPQVTWNPADRNSNLTLSNGNLNTQGNLVSGGAVRATSGKSSGKWYWEVWLTAINSNDNARIGVGNSSMSLNSRPGDDSNGWGYQTGTGARVNNGNYVAYGSALGNGDILGVALDMDAGTLRFYRNGVDLGVAFTGLTGTIFPAYGYDANNSVFYTNFGAEGFAYTVPSGFSAIGGNGVTPGLRMKRLNFQGNYINPATDTVFVTWFGANGSDTTFDNTDTLEAIIAGNFKRIHFPDGIYRVNGPSLNNYALAGNENRGLLVRSNSIISGNGTHRSIILMDGIVNETSSTYYSVFLCTGDTVTNVRFRGLTFRGKNYMYDDTESLDNPQAINVFLGADFITVDSCKFEYLYGHGVADFGNGIGTGGYSTVTNSIARYCSKNGFNMNSPYLRFTGNYGFRNKFSLLEASTGHSIITNNIAEENDFLGIAVGGYTDSTEANRDGGFNIIANNTVFGSNSKGLSLSGGTSYSLVFNNTVYYNGDQGLILSEDPTWGGIKTRNNYLFNNTSYDNGFTSGSGGPQGIYIDANQNRVYNNTVYRTGTVTWRGRTFNQSFGIITSSNKVDQLIANNNIYGSHSLGDYYLRMGNNAIWTDTGFLAGRLIRMAVEPRTAEPRTWSQVFGSLNLSSTTAYETILTGIDPNSLHTLQLQYGPSNLLDSVSLITTRPPSIELGNDTTINSLANFTLTSTASDLDGSIASYQWHIMRRPYLSVSDIVNPTSATATLDSLSYGEYYVMCEVTDNRGAKNVDYRVITVALPNTPPTANAGADSVITQPDSNVSLVGSGTDADGTIVSYAWTKLTGTGSTITSPASATTTVTGLSSVVYTFRLVVTDNLGATDDDTVQVFVNRVPVSDAGANQTITSPSSAVTLSGSGSDTDGSISTYAWTKISGVGGTITSPSSAVTTVTGLTVGAYVFRLTVTDNRGATATDDISITVNAAISSSANQTISEPNRLFPKNNFAPPRDTTFPAIRNGELRVQSGEYYRWSGVRWAAIVDTTTVSTRLNALKMVSDSAKVLRAAINSAIPISSLTAATGANTINNGNNTQTWQWNSLTGTGIELSSTSTAGSFTNTLLNITRSGANASSGITSRGIASVVSNSGAASINYGGFFVANNGAENYGVFGGTNTSNGVGVYGIAAATSGGIGVRAYTGGAGTTYGVISENIGTGTAYGGHFTGATYGGYFAGATAIVTPPAGGNVGFGTLTPSSRAILELNSVTQGLLLPRMTTAQRDAITTPPAGLMVYDTTTNKVSVFNGTIWRYLAYE